MNKIAIALLGVALHLGCLDSNAQAADANTGAVTFSGTFDWGRKKDQKIQGVFTPDGANKWKVVWTFKWKKKDEIYTGSAEGNLVNGSVKGSAIRMDHKDKTKPHPKDKRKFTFNVTAKDGTLSGKHSAKGTISLKKT